MKKPHKSVVRAAEEAVAAGSSHPDAKRAALATAEQRSKDVDKIARHALYAVVYLIRDGGMRGSYAELDDATWAEVIDRIRLIISDEVGKTSVRNYEAALDRLTKQSVSDSDRS